MLESPAPHYQLGQIVKLKKPHPCGDNQWEILRVGADFRLRCLGCGRLIMLSRRKFEKRVVEILEHPTHPDEPER